MASKRDQAPIAPARTLSGAGTQFTDPVTDDSSELRGSFASRFRKPAEAAGGMPGGLPRGMSAGNPAGMSGQPDGGASLKHVRQAKLRLVQVEPWSVMKASFVLSVAVGIVTVVAVGIVWSVLGAAGLWDSVNSIVRDSVGSDNGTAFQIQKYVGTSRIIGFTMIVAVADVVLITAIATLGAFLYNLAATLVGGVEVTFAEDR
jgi:hypothetical protein